jgi:hypothetical protein
MRNACVLVAALALGGCRPVTPSATVTPEERASDQAEEEADEAMAEFEAARAEVKAALDDARKVAGEEPAAKARAEAAD